MPDDVTRSRAVDDTHQGEPRVVNVQRCCNGCQRPLRDAHRSECDAAMLGRPLPDVRAECPDCSHATPDRVAEIEASVQARLNLVMDRGLNSDSNATEALTLQWCLRVIRGERA